MNLNAVNLTAQLRNRFIVAACAACLSTSVGLAQQNSGGQTQTAPAGQSGYGTPNGANPLAGQTAGSAVGQDRQVMDKHFVHTALQGGMAEVQLGQLALQKSSNDDVKQFAQKMVDDHTKLGDQLKPIAQQMNVTIPDAPSGKDKATMAKLQALNGDAFDKAYIRDMVKDHEKDQKLFKDEAQTTTNPDLKQAVTQAEQVIDGHLQMAKQLAQKDNVVASR